MRDFQLVVYLNLLRTLKNTGYHIFPVISCFSGELKRTDSVFLRHDVDRFSGNSLKIAELEAEMGIRSSYYFRVVPESFDEIIIKKIAGMGHEIGYHYENLSTVLRRKDFRKSQIPHSKFQTKSQGERLTAVEGGKQSSCLLSPDTCDLHSNPNSEIPNPKDRILNDPEMKKLFELAIEDFEKNLARFREIVPVRTICMHGSPLSRIDNRDLWKVYDYRDFGIIGEPYFDIDFSEVFYLTDTGRRWDGDRVSVRDRVEQGDRQWPVYKTTSDIIEAVEAGTFPSRAMITTHPQRWTDNPFSWTKELMWQNMKNVIKKYYVR